MFQKFARILGAEIPKEVLLDDVDAAANAYKNYIKEKAYEPKTPLSKAALIPAAVATGLAKSYAYFSDRKKSPWTLPLGIGAAIGAMGAGYKFFDDSQIREARQLLKDPNLDAKLREVVRNGKPQFLTIHPMQIKPYFSGLLLKKLSNTLQNSYTNN